MLQTPNFGYNENPGGGIGFSIQRQRAALEPFWQDFKIWTDSTFINLSHEQMVDAVRQLLAQTVDSNVFKGMMRSKFGADEMFFERVRIIRNDVQQYTVAVEIHCDSIPGSGGLGVPLLRFFVYLENEDYDYDLDRIESTANVAEVNVFNLTISGLEELVDYVYDSFEEKRVEITKDHKNALIRWYIPSSHGGLKDYNFQLKKDWEIDADHYPWIKGDLRSYYQSFKDSRSQILVLYGEPGTGKTTFIRDLICEMNMNAIISYDLKVITSDVTFVRYLSDKNFDAIIIEDADELLTSARGDYNKIISKILNVSDGLIKLPRKKLIFTTNLDKLTDLDPAIIRPGRCFDVMEFRSFTQDEARKVADKLGVQLSDEDKAKKHMTLAEIYAAKELQELKDPMVTTSNQIKKPAFGFI